MSAENADCSGAESIERIGLIGYGEAGQLLARAFVEANIDVTVLTRSPDRLRERLSDSPIAVADSYASLAAETELVCSCVWPATAADVAAETAPGLAPGQPFLDLNSVSPATTEQIVDKIEAAGGTPLKATIMGSAAAGRDSVRLVIGGPDRADTVAALRAVGFTVQDVGADPMHPALLKMFRSTFTKGMRELVAETLAPAVAYGVHEDVLDDLNGLFDERSVEEWMRTALENTPEHAQRRLGELREVRQTTADAGYRAPIIDETIALHEELLNSSDDDYVAVLEALKGHLSDDSS
ncbi:NAD(P)-binding domain-containing protein (plasmid) [Natrinema zhouii]|uniref:NAD(P)-binding domain-containing protein n=1 Tax=Natrinema zhouii TaxID=1710539 RepID=UPI001D00112E|nr:NAD(P)-binding domain-containing protein [Natrinema zhouii]UHQ98882.1 NAD(P)-binding domain-containing protein [Natrinema zhouii]